MIVAYLRTGASRKEALKEQEEVIMGFASGRNIEIDEWVTDIIPEKRRKKGEEKDDNLAHALNRMQKDDRLIVSDIIRLGRTLWEVMTVLSRCAEKGIQFYCIKNRYALDKTLNLEVVGDVFKLVTEIEQSMISTRSKEMIHNKKKTLGRPKGTVAKQSFLNEHKEEIISMIERGDTSFEICRHFNVSRNTYFAFKRNYKV